MKEINFKIIIPCYNCEKWLPDCIDSIEKQTYKNYEIIIINDASTDGTMEWLDSYPVRSGHICLKSNTENVGALQNIVDGIKIISTDPEDVIVLIDGDDWLAHNDVFSLLNKTYQDENIWLTYGQYKHLSEKHRGICGPLTNTRRYRKYRSWRTSHLRTFKSHLWNGIKDEDLRDTTGKYYSMTWDLAFMFPMIEMAGLKRIKYIRDILYIYNDFNPLNDDKKDRELQLKLEKEIRNRPIYDEL